MEKVNEIKLPEGVESISVTQHDDKIVIEFIPEKPKFKEGDFVYEDGRIMIVKSYPNMYHANVYPEYSDNVGYNSQYGLDFSSPTFRHATEEEKQTLLDALAKEGKRWNAEKKCIEDIPKRKFKKGDKVRIKHGVSSKTHRNILPVFADEMDDLIGKTMTVDRYTDVDSYVVCNEFDWRFHEDWLEPYEELKEGDLAIFWDNVSRHYASVRIFGCLTVRGYCDINGVRWDNAIKFDGKEQFEKVLRGEI